MSNEGFTYPLTFIGCGSAFHTALGNNGGYFYHQGELGMFDCGSATFERLLRFGVLENVEKITILLTHTHPDHIGSLGDFIFYSYIKMTPAFKAKLCIKAPRTLLMHAKDLVMRMGVEEGQAIWQPLEEGSTFGPYNVTALPAEHAPHLECYSYECVHETKNEHFYYSGDAKDIPQSVLNRIKEDYYQMVYQDTSFLDYPGNVHLSLTKLESLIPTEKRRSICCMHLDETFPIEEVKEKGFHVATDYQVKEVARG
ncbi:MULTISPECIES: MBL fold metallo-hydrolase [Bacillaceae]|uniref:Metallo-beta-lactamase domain-containing protein n=1 Tax=Alkalicoccobacillus plakortidis TaxID=444060 RepID=A0A9D5DTY0_9BACI|nr:MULTISPECIES: MBL fold metallo-hydrolase [Bacillaceae]KQL57063.1 hypothetical protein AN965_10320 [Alkalicoccobacillus plakortidis]